MDINQIATYESNYDPAWRQEWFPQLDVCEMVYGIIEGNPDIAIVGSESPRGVSFFTMVFDDASGHYVRWDEGYVTDRMASYLGHLLIPNNLPNTLFRYYREHPDHTYLNDRQDEPYEQFCASYDGEILSDFGGILRVRYHDREMGEGIVVDLDRLEERSAQAGGGTLGDGKAMKQIMDIVKATGRRV